MALLVAKLYISGNPCMAASIDACSGLDVEDRHQSGNVFLLYFAGYETLRVISNALYRAPNFDTSSPVVEILPMRESECCSR